MKKDYKVEMKPTLWQVVLSRGAYSDYTEENLFFSGNDENEIWLFLCRYLDDVDEGGSYSWQVHNIKFGDLKRISPKYTGDVEDISWSSDYDTWDVEINRLNVIYFKN